VALNDEKAHPRAFVAVTKDGPGVTLLDEKTNMRSVLEVDEHGPFMAPNDEKTTPRAVLGRMPLETVRTGAKEITAPSSLTLFDKKGKVIWRAP
jgi:hypothetical protein